MRFIKLLMNRWSAPTVGVGLIFALGAPAEAAGPINVTQLPLPCPNANGADSLDDTAAFNCALGLVPAGQAGEIYVPAGTYNLSSQITVFDKAIAFRGEGQRITNLRFTGLPFGHNGLDFTSSNVATHQTFAVRSLSVLRADGEGAVAIRAQWPHTPVGQPDFTNGGGVSITIEDVHIGTDSWTSSGPHWHRGIWLHNARFAKVHTFNIHGLNQASAGVAGIHISGSLPEPPSSPTIGVSIHDGSILGFIRGVHAVQNTRGLNVQNLKIRDALWGVDLFGAGADIGTSIANCHIRASLRGITVYDTAGDMAISNNVIYREGTGEFIGIEMNRGAAGQLARMRVIGNTVFATASGGARYGITMANNVHGGVIQGNTTHNMTIGIWLVNGPVTGTHVVGNINRAPGGTQIANGGTNTYQADNW